MLGITVSLTLEPVFKGLILLYFPIFQVLKLEDDMRMEEGIPNNKIKSELIDYIRGGGNASTPPSCEFSVVQKVLATVVSVNSTIPKPSPLVQQFISQTMAGRTGQTPSQKKENLDDDPFNGMSMSDKLAALVGLTPSSGNVEGVMVEEKKCNTTLVRGEDIINALIQLKENKRGGG